MTNTDNLITVTDEDGNVFLIRPPAVECESTEVEDTEPQGPGLLRRAGSRTFGAVTSAPAHALTGVKHATGLVVLTTATKVVAPVADKKNRILNIRAAKRDFRDQMADKGVRIRLDKRAEAKAEAQVEAAVNIRPDVAAEALGFAPPEAK